MNTSLKPSENTPPLGRVLCGATLAGLALITLAGCASKPKQPWDQEPQIWKRKDPVDPVEERVFYSGWRHPT